VEINELLSVATICCSSLYRLFLGILMKLFSDNHVFTGFLPRKLFVSLEYQISIKSIITYSCNVLQNVT